MLVAISRQPATAEAIDTVNGEALRAGVIAGVIGVIVGLLFAQLIALRLRRLTAATEAIAQRRLRDAAALPLPRRVRPARPQLRPDAPPAAPLASAASRPSATGCGSCSSGSTRECSRSTRISSSTSRTPRRAGSSAGACAEGDALPEPWQGFGLREFAQGLFDERSAVTQVHVTPDEQHAYGVVGIPSQPETDWALLVVDDLTEQERRELAEREFVSNAAHELRTPLTTIIGAVEVLQAGAKEDPAERDRFLGHIEREAGRLARLARAMLTLARAHSGQEPPRVEAVELAPLLREVAAGLQPHDGVAVDVEVANGLAVEANRDLLEQALRNLGENAAKHTARGSVVLRAYRDGNTVTIEVEDSGPGISPEVQRHVFDRFYRGERDAHGFGLGLAIVRESVRTLGGRIELDSSPGEGTVFRILLAPARVREEVPAA